MDVDAPSIESRVFTNLSPETTLKMVNYATTDLDVEEIAVLMPTITY